MLSNVRKQNFTSLAAILKMAGNIGSPFQFGAGGIHSLAPPAERQRSFSNADSSVVVVRRQLFN